MTTLKCAFADKIRLYDQVLKDDASRVFVPTQDEMHPGTEVELEIQIGRTPPVTTHGTVSGTRTRRGTGHLGQPGVWVQLPSEEIDALSQAIQIADGEATTTTVRNFPRFDVSLRVLIEKPVVRTLRTVNLSQSGACLGGSLPVPVGQTLKLTIEFADESVEVFGKLSWQRPEIGRLGIEFRFQTDAARDMVRRKTRELADLHAGEVYAKPTILAVDDDLAALRTVNRTLAAQGYGTLSAISGPEALSVARECAPALILLDVLLPTMNGLEVCRILKRDAQTSQLPVILVSGLGREQLAMVLEESGALGALSKPYQLKTLRELVQGIFDSHRALVTPGDDKAAERRRTLRVPAFLHGYYESKTLHVETTLRDLSDTGGFLISYWGDPIGTTGTLSISRPDEDDLIVEFEVVRRADWGFITNPGHAQLPGIGVQWKQGKGTDELRAWLTQHSADMSEKPTIVVIDDDRSHLEILSTVLKQSGFSVVTLDSPMGVTNAISLAKPVLVIVDFMMPCIDGAQLSQLLKGDERTKGMKVWLYSSLSEEHLQRLATQATADGYIQKGTRPSEIVRRIKEFLGM